MRGEDFLRVMKLDGVDCFDVDELVERMSEFGYLGFKEWFRGKTGGIDPVTGSFLVYKYDFDRWLRGFCKYNGNVRVFNDEVKG